MSNVRLESYQSEDRDAMVYTLTLSRSALCRPPLRPLDRMLLEECARPDATVSDVLLGLELLVRRIEEAT